MQHTQSSSAHKICGSLQHTIYTATVPIEPSNSAHNKHHIIHGAAVPLAQNMQQYTAYNNKKQQCPWHKTCSSTQHITYEATVCLGTRWQHPQHKTCGRTQHTILCIKIKLFLLYYCNDRKVPLPNFKDVGQTQTVLHIIRNSITNINFFVLYCK